MGVCCEGMHCISQSRQSAGMIFRGNILSIRFDPSGVKFYLFYFDE